MKNIKIHDILGIGLGPSNLALAVAIEDHKCGLSSLFIDNKSHFSWHSGMMLSDSKLQMSFLKDLVTVSNPQSKFTFLNYLKSKKRLNEFIALRKQFPTRTEFTDYLQWAEQQLTQDIKYNTLVEKIIPHKTSSSGNIKTFEVVAKDLRSGIQFSLYGKNIVLGVGMTPNYQSKMHERNPAVFHSSKLLNTLVKNYTDQAAPYHFVVVGSGQSGAEVVLYLLSTYPNAKVTAISNGFLYRSIDDNSFVNKLYCGEYSKQFYQLSVKEKSKMLNTIENSNYSVADIEVIEKIAAIDYECRVRDQQRLYLKSFCNVQKHTLSDGKVSIQISNNNLESIEELTVDALCFATGYNDNGMKKILEGVTEHYQHDSNGNLVVDANFKLQPKHEIDAAIYLQGYSRFSHGFTEGSITDLAIRSQSILQSVYSDIYDDSNTTLLKRIKS
jgi:L-ornithine N5-oxygenase